MMSSTETNPTNVSYNNIKYSPEAEKALEAFVKTTQQTGKVEVAPELLHIIEDIATTGLMCYPWQYVKVLMDAKFKEILLEFHSTNPQSDLENVCRNFLQCLNQLHGPPFTIQRLCELALRPKNYSTMKKYIFALEKLVTVSSMTDILNPHEYDNSVRELGESLTKIQEDNQTPIQRFSIPTEMHLDSTDITSSFPKTEQKPIEEYEEPMDVEHS